MSGVGGQQVLQQARAEPGHGGADGQLGCLQGRPAGASDRAAALASCSISAVASAANAVRSPLFPRLARPGTDLPWPGGLASQIASVTSTICSLTARNSR